MKESLNNHHNEIIDEIDILKCSIKYNLNNKLRYFRLISAIEHHLELERFFVNNIDLDVLPLHNKINSLLKEIKITIMESNNSDVDILTKLIVISNLTTNAIHKESNGNRN